MVFSEIHDWQGSPAVKQILVFPSEVEKRGFEVKFAERVKKSGIEAASDSDIGAIYKLRAVKNSSPGSYSAIIRSGKTGEMILESRKTYDSARSAMEAAIELLKEHAVEICYKRIKALKKKRKTDASDLDSLINTLVNCH